MGRSWVLLVLAFLLGVSAVPVSSAQEEADIFNAGVPFFVSFGNPRASHLTLGTGYANEGGQPFHGCALVMLRPDRMTGELILTGLLNDTNLIEAVMPFGPDEEDFANETADFPTPSPAPVGVLPPGDGFARNVTVDGSWSHKAPLHPAVYAHYAGLSEAFLRVDTQEFLDPVTEEGTFRGEFSVTREGFRDNTTKSIRTVDGKDWRPGETSKPLLDKEWEMHLSILGGSGAGISDKRVFASPGDLPDGSMSYQTAHYKTYTFNNTKFTGSAQMVFSSQTNAVAGLQTALTFVVIKPSGYEVANVTLRPSFNAPASQTIDFPLSELGNYVIRVTGAAYLARYNIDVTLNPPKSFELNFWWEDLIYGEDAYYAYAECPTTWALPVLSHVQRKRGVDLREEILAVTAAGGILSCLYVVKMASDSIGSSKFRDTFRRK